MTDHDDQAPGISRNATILVLGLGVLAVVATAIFYRDEGFKITAEAGGQRIEFDFEGREVALNEILNRLLSDQSEDSADTASQRQLVEAVLQRHSFYHVPSIEAATAISKIGESEATREFVRSIRRILYDLEGPFSRPATFSEVPDDRVQLALSDLYRKNPSSPLIAKLWEMSVELKGMFSLREIKIAIRLDQTLPEGSAATCAGSILLNKTSLITMNHERFVEVLVDHPRPCSPASAEELLSGEGTTVWLSTSDVNRILETSAISNSHEISGILIPLPQSLRNTG